MPACLLCGSQTDDSLSICTKCRQTRPQVVERLIAVQGQRGKVSVADFLRSDPGKLLIVGMLITVAVVILTRLVGWGNVSSNQFRLPAGITAPNQPQQIMLSGTKTWQKDGAKIIALASYTITARVVIRTNFVMGNLSEHSPYDLALAWGVMSDTQALKTLSFQHWTRRVSWNSDNPPYNWDVVNANMCNMHVLPADDKIAEQIASLKTDDIVTLEGYLVEVQAPGYGPWRSSLSRTDTGDGACEIMWVERVTLSKPN